MIKAVKGEIILTQLNNVRTEIAFLTIYTKHLDQIVYFTCAHLMHNTGSLVQTS